MKKNLVSLFLLLCAASIVWGASLPVGIITPLDGEGEIYVDDQKISEPTLVAKQNLIRLGKNGVAELKMNNGDRFILASETIVRVKEYFDEEDQTSQKPSLFEIIKGKVQALIEGKDKEKLLIQTGNAVIGVKGTDFVVEVPSPHLTQVTTLSGIVSFQRTDQKKESSGVTLQAGFRSLLVKTQPPTPPLSISIGDRLEINRLFLRLRRPFIRPIRTSSDRVVDNTLKQEIKNRIVQQALRNQAALIVDVVF